MDVSSIHSIRRAFSRGEICYFDEFVCLILFWFCSIYKRSISLQIPSVAMLYSHWNDSRFQKKIKSAFFANNQLGRQSLKGQIKINWRRIKQANRFGEQSASAYAIATLLSEYARFPIDWLYCCCYWYWYCCCCGYHFSLSMVSVYLF